METLQEEFAGETDEVCEPEWRTQLSDLEMIKAAKLILLNRNPLYYLRQIANRRKVSDIPLYEEAPESLQTQREEVSKKHDSIAHLRYDYKGESGIQSDALRSKPRSLIQMLSHKWANESNEVCHSAAGRHRGGKHSDGTFCVSDACHHKSHLAEAPQNESFLRAVKHFSKTRNSKHFSERFLERVDAAFEKDPTLLYLRVLGSESNIHGKTVNDQIYNVFNFFEFRKQNDFLKLIHGPKAIDRFFRENYYETNQLSRTNEVIFFANKLRGNLWKIQQLENNKFNVWLQKETNASVDNSHFKFGAYFASKGPASFSFTICNMSDELSQQLTDTKIYSRVNDQKWNRDTLCCVSKDTLSFTFVKEEGVEQVEFSLFVPVDGTKAIENVLKKCVKLDELKRNKARIAENHRKDASPETGVKSVEEPMLRSAVPTIEENAEVTSLKNVVPNVTSIPNSAQLPTISDENKPVNGRQEQPAEAKDHKKEHSNLVYSNK